MAITGLEDPYAIAVAGGKLYWTEDHDWEGGSWNAKIKRASIDGDDAWVPEVLVTSGQNGLAGIALDVAGGKMYWTECSWSFDPSLAKIKRANLEGKRTPEVSG